VGKEAISSPFCLNHDFLDQRIAMIKSPGLGDLASVLNTGWRINRYTILSTRRRRAQDEAQSAKDGAAASWASFNPKNPGSDKMRQGWERIPARA
jgi:hypothetical protein